MIKSKNPRRLSFWICLLGLCLAWVIGVIAVNPQGNFPLIDDGAYVHSVLVLLKTGRYTIASNISPTAVAQIVAGAAVAKIFGFSYVTLRKFTLVCGLLSIIAVYLITGVFARSPLICFIPAAAVAWNPVFLVLSCTFMTDVPFFAATAWSCYFYLLSASEMTNRRTNSTLIATILAAAAVLIRQFALAVPVAYLTYCGLNDRRKLRDSFLSVLAVAFSLASFELVAKNTGVLPNGYGTMNGAVEAVLSLGPLKLLKLESKRILLSAGYIGLFTLPLSTLLIPARLMTKTVCVLIVTFLVTLFLVSKQFIMPFDGVLLHWNAVGFFGLRDQYNLPWNNARYIWGTITFISLLSACVGFSLFWTKTQTIAISLNRSAIFSVALFVILAMPLVVWGADFERYYLPLLIPMVMLFAIRFTARSSADTIRLLLSFCCLLMFAVFAVAGTHDYFAWNRARWQLINRLQATAHPKCDTVDGGFEFNYWHYHFDNKNSCWKYEDQGKPEYVIALSAMRGYEIVDERAYDRWLPTLSGTVVLLKKLH